MKTQVGIGWRPEIALLVEEQRIEFTEIVAENFWNAKNLDPALTSLVERGVTVIPHGVSLSLGSAQTPDLWRLEKLAKLAAQTKAPFVSEHIALVRGGGYESGHLLPIERTEEMLEIVIENVRIAQSNLPGPLVLENIATVLEWEGEQMTEAEFVSRVLEETGAMLLLDVANLYANCFNHGVDYRDYLKRIPLHKLAYVHVAGGVFRDELYHDTHAHALVDGPLQILEELCSMTAPPAVLLERDDKFDSIGGIADELARVRRAVALGEAQRQRMTDAETEAGCASSRAPATTELSRLEENNAQSLGERHQKLDQQQVPNSFRVDANKKQSKFVSAIFDTSNARTKILRDTLIRKRANTISRRFPQFEQELGIGYQSRFKEHALANAHLFVDDAHVDGRRFAQHLRRKQRLDSIKAIWRFVRRRVRVTF